MPAHVPLGQFVDRAAPARSLQEFLDMFCVAYRFHPLEEDHTAFIACWKEMTQLIERELGGLGSRLHLTEDGDLYAYAQWPDRASWERMWDAEETGRMAELSSHWRQLAGPSEIVFAGEVVEDLHHSGGD